MSRYVERALGWVESDYVVRDSRPLEVCPDVDGAKEVDTGLLTATGKRIFRVAPPVGFGRDNEW